MAWINYESWCYAISCPSFSLLLQLGWNRPLFILSEVMVKTTQRKASSLNQRNQNKSNDSRREEKCSKCVCCMVLGITKYLLILFFALKNSLKVILQVFNPKKPFITVPDASEWNHDETAAYLYYCANETVHGIEFPSAPESPHGVPLVADISSNFMSREFDFKNHGVVFGGTQKNLGAAGLTVVFVRKDLIGNDSKNLESKRYRPILFYLLDILGPDFLQL